MRVALVAAQGIGDGLILMVLAHHLTQLGHKVTLLSTPLVQLRGWFPGKEIIPFPDPDETFLNYDRVIAMDHSCAYKRPLPHLISLPEGSFNKRLTLAKNLSLFAKQEFGFEDSSLNNGLVPPRPHTKLRFPNRLVLHPTSRDPKKDWEKTKFLKLAQKLLKKGYEVSFCLAPEERFAWEPLLKQTKIQLPHFESLSDLAQYLFESRALIGNDSGPAHLASNLGIDTLSLFARKSTARFWRPAWGKNRIITPLPFAIGAPMKQRLWNQLLPVWKVLRSIHYK